ncbi:CoA-binding protein [Clostridium sp. D2Q-11]|uniref:CoA-binding protein n=1 Tax=Anaeromonas frigoriresistens TaxID=2683708 RepID=A0A942UZ24_9FIRM|nr:CoA-binding protein [Anaeromonas frigoriresistens]MBS4539636.1 CoA-binding protein [Anaeromonas frigoriresistens]
MNNENLRNEMLDKKVWAVLGVSPNKEKFGYKIYKKLKDNNYEVYPINPKYDDIEGQKCYKSIEDLPVTPDVLDFVVPPQVSLAAIDKAKDKGIENLWFQPGTSNDEVVNKAKDNEFKVIHNDCVLVALGH